MSYGLAASETVIAGQPQGQIGGNQKVVIGIPEEVTGSTIIAKVEEINGLDPYVDEVSLKYQLLGTDKVLISRI